VIAGSGFGARARYCCDLHQGHHIGYNAPDWRWVAHSRMAIEITVLKQALHKPLSPPAPGMAPWAPHIVYAPQPRWPVIIPLGLLAGLMAGAWLLMEWGFLPHIGQLAGGL